MRILGYIRAALTAAALALVVAGCATTPALAQGGALVHPPITTGHCASWFNSYTIQDSGTSCVGGGSYNTVFDVVKTYGGDPTGAADNTAAFNAAKVACAAGPGGIIWFQAGTYKFTSNITNASTNCSILGAGAKATTLSATGITGDFLTMSTAGVNTVTLRDLRITNGGSWTSGYGVSWQCSDCLMQNVWIDLTPQAIHATNFIDSRFQNIHVNDMTSSPFIVCDNGVGAVFGAHWSELSIGSFGGNTTATGFHQGAGCNSLIMSGVDVVTLNVCFDNSTDSGSFTTFYDFECDHSQNGIYFNGGDGIQIVNSWFGSALAGNGVTFAATFDRYATITGSQIRTNTQAGVFMGGSGGIALTGNVISGNGAFNVAVGAGVSNFTIASNQIGVITSVGDPTSPYCVFIAGGASNYYNVSNNVCGVNNTIGISDGGSGVKKVVAGNVGP